jgi:ribonuclease HI
MEYFQRRGLRTADGKRPTNLDLFLKLDEVIMNLERDDVAIGFWQIPRAYNHKADRLAKLATNV